MSAAPELPSGLRDYQREAINAVRREFSKRRSTLIVQATGTGKTVEFAVLAELAAKSGRRVLVLVHRDELVRQAVEKLQTWTRLSVGVEKAEQRAVKSGGFLSKAEILERQGVVVASVQSISKKKRLERFAKDEFGLVICDEAHHAVAGSWRAVVDHFADAFVLGCTATPDRADQLALGQVFGSVAYEYDLRRAIEEKNLVPICQQRVVVDGLDLSKLRKKMGDFSTVELEAILSEEKHVQAIANPVFELSGDRPTLLFGATVAHAQLLEDQLNRRAAAAGDPRKRARTIHGGTPEDDRRASIAAFMRGEFQFLSSCSIFLEGTDLPPVACVAMARPTQSRALYCQAVGRGTRLSPGKNDLLVLDFVGNSGRHPLVTAVDLFAGDMTPPERKAAEEVAAANPGMRADEIAKAAKEKAAAEERRLAGLRARRDVIAGTLHRVYDVDPFVRGIVGEAEAVRGSGEIRAMTQAQRNALIRNAFPIDEKKYRGMDSATANALIRSLRARREKGLCSFKQARLLERLGKAGANDTTFADAKRIIDVAVANDWRLPEGVQ